MEGVLQRQPLEEEEELLQPKGQDLQSTPRLQRQAESEEEEELLQPKPDGGGFPGVAADLEAGIQAQRGGGEPLSEASRSFFEPRLGVDLSAVRVHADANADAAAGAVNARAFTVGRDVFFAAGQYSSQSHMGKSLLAHEMAHVVQQNYQGKAGIMRKAYVWPGIEKKYAYKAKSKPKPKPGCIYPAYPGMLGVARRGLMWYPHDFVGPRQSGAVTASKSTSGYAVPRSSTNLYNCMRWAVGHGAPTSRQWWQGVRRSSSVPWPEEKFLKDKGCSKISASGKSNHKVKLYEYKHQDQFHIIRQEADGAWSSKIGAGPLYRGVTSPDTHTAGHYVPMNHMKPTYWSCP